MTICSNCTKKATFNFMGKKARYCVEHKSEGMTDVLNKSCQCGLAQPTYNIAGLKAAYCSKCKTVEMVDLKHKICTCGAARPCFNFEGLKAEYCNSCKLEGMKNVVDKKCVCGKYQPMFNFEGLSGKYCSECKLEGMCDVKNKKCACKKSRPSFNFEGLIARYCSLCKTEGMIDVMHTKCVCKKNQAHFNYNGLFGKYCSECKLEGMIDIHHKKCVCTKFLPTYNFEGLVAKYCSECRLEGMIDTVHVLCKTYLCDIRVQEKYDGYCFRCFIHLFPDKPVSKNYKTKEFAVVEYITQKYPDLTWNADKKVQDGCSLKRPDLLLDLGYQIIIIEIDENQHTNYDCSCDNKRLMTLSQDVGHRPIIFIRFNPDSYINEKGEKIKSCWTITAKTGLLKISNKKEWIIRLDNLLAQIDYWCIPENKTDKTVEVIQLYFNQN
jgi:hypothetical protein